MKGNKEDGIERRVSIVGLSIGARQSKAVCVVAWASKMTVSAVVERLIDRAIEDEWEVWERGDASEGGGEGE